MSGKPLHRLTEVGVAVPLAGYAAVVVAAPSLSGPILAVLAGAWLMATGWSWDRHHRPWNPRYHFLLWPVIHFLVLATGGAGSVLLVAVAAWVALAGTFEGWQAPALAGGMAAITIWLGELGAGAGQAVALVEVGTTALVGAGLAYGAQRLRRRGAESHAELRLIREEARIGRTAGDALSEAARRVEELRQALEMVRRGLAAWRVVVWDVEAESERARPRVAVGGPMPPGIQLFGDPLRITWLEGVPLRLDAPAVWGREGDRLGAIAITPSGERSALLTIEVAGDAPALTPEALQDAGRYLRVFVTMQRREAEAEARRERLDQIMTLLKRLPGEMEPDTFPTELAAAAADVVGGSGAAVARWHGETGRVAAVVGMDGGPAAGTYVRRQDSELGLAAHTGSVIYREERGVSGLPVAAPDERWSAYPRTLVSIPLMDGAGSVWGVIGVWSSRGPGLDPDAVDLLQALAPLLALQLQHAGDIVQLKEQVKKDALTGLYNRRAFDERLDLECVHFQRYRRPVSMIVCDLDRFKSINDSFGHEAGDAVLRVVGEVVEATVREVDYAARYGGEEIVVLLPETVRSQAIHVAERLRERIADSRVGFDGADIDVQASFGVSACPECVEDPEELLQSADAMLYQSKREGRNRVTAAPIVGPDQGTPRVRRPPRNGVDTG